MSCRRQSARPLLVAVLLAATSAGIAAELEGVGRELGYRLFGDAKKNRPVLVQNSRAGAIEVFDAARGEFVEVSRYSDAEIPCRGGELRLKVRYRDSFRESVPFQVLIACGREIPFVEPARIATPRPVALPGDASAAVPASTDTGGAPSVVDVAAGTGGVATAPDSP